MSFNTLDCGTFDCFSPITGSALTIPKGFWLPGTAAIYQGYFGTTSILNYAMGTCNVGMSPTAPFAYTGAAGNVNFHNLSLTTYMGDHLVVGRSSVAGSELRANVANVHLVGANTTIVGAKTSVAGAKTDVSGAVCNINGPVINIGGRNWYASAAQLGFKKRVLISLTQQKRIIDLDIFVLRDQLQMFTSEVNQNLILLNYLITGLVL